MTHDVCDQLWRVEAALDGRLDARSAHSLEAHLPHCATCRAERAALLTLKRELRQVAAHLDEQSVRALRKRTLDAAHAERMLRPYKRWGKAAAAVAACATLAFLSVPRSTGPATVTAPAPRRAVVVLPEQGAQWQRNLESNIERVVLASGILSFRVARTARDPRLVVSVPDGEIEDLGTVFSVSVEGGRTVEIRVEEGRVVFHRRGLPSLPLLAGSTFRPAQEPKPVAVEASAPPVAPAVQGQAPTPTGRSKRARERQRAQPPSATPARATPDVVDAGERARGEDRAYLRVIDLLRRGRVDDARRAAQSYLSSYPDGFRRPEVSRLVEELGTGAGMAPPVR